MATERPLPNLWHATAPAAPETGPLTGDVASDVAIIGGGFTGLSAALHLAEMGVKATVIEARMIGYGGSGRNVGLVNAGMWVKPDDLIATLGAEAGGRLLNELGDGPAFVYDLVARHGIECEVVRNGTLHMAVGAGGDHRARGPVAEARRPRRGASSRQGPCAFGRRRLHGRIARSPGRHDPAACLCAGAGTGSACCRR